MSDTEFSIKIRPACETDTAYLSSTWLKAYLSGSGLSGRMDHAAYFELHRPVVADLLARCSVLVAHPEGDPDTILGFSVSEPTVLHWLYVRNAWRGNGIARQLLEAAGLIQPSPMSTATTAELAGTRLVFTHWTDTAAHLMRRFKGLVYYPYLVSRSAT